MGEKQGAARALWVAKCMQVCRQGLTRAVRAAVFHAGPSTQMNWFTNLDGDGTTTAAGNRGPTAMNGNAVMYEAGKILAVGGAPSFSQVRTPS